eukprot:TRINITY_DN5835_c0_g1_i2.p1 TRINITY_DN5835_c0_g1~~TRINITY_DN5835_c0_g1_i2.p1  ORF type:complete len:289 (+),score=67.43 TRINITY_DN5835_c0_g1_i2:258-1124(+)
MKGLLTDIYTMMRPNSTHFRKKNDFLPFENQTNLEFLSDKNDASILVFGNHNKKRPNNLTFIRTFDYQVLDMAEFGVTECKHMQEFKTDKSMFGSKPCILFQGEQFNVDPELIKIRSLLLDVFRGRIVDNINLAGLDRLVVFTALSATKIKFNHYRIIMKRSGTKLPRVELEEQGPRFTMTPRRSRWATGELLKESMKVPRNAKAKKTKNITHDGMGDKVGRIHMEKQDLNKMALRRFKGTKRGRDSEAAEGGEGNATTDPSGEQGSTAAAVEETPLRRSKRKRTVST